MLEKIGRWVIVLFFVLLLLIPLAAMDHQKGKVSPTENRVLADFPEIFHADGSLAAGLRGGFMNWFDDHLGFRSRFVELANKMKLSLLRQSPSAQVEFGRDGWLYYTPDHNIELASGEYVLSESILETIAHDQQEISDRYAAEGIGYLLVLTPAKTSIYPEYIASRDCEVRETVCDQMEQYLSEHTSVNVVNVKTAILNNKDKGQMFWKIDTHFTQLGAYIAYQAISDKLDEMGITMREFDVSITEDSTEGIRDLPLIMGVAENFGETTTSYVNWEHSSGSVEIPELSDYYAKGLIPVSIGNQKEGNGKTLLIYGDSQWLPERNLPFLFGESFSSVVSNSERFLDANFENLLSPDVVIYSCGERLIDSVLTNTAVPE